VVASCIGKVIKGGVDGGVQFLVLLVINMATAIQERKNSQSS
jgi:hypothetical protein